MADCRLMRLMSVAYNTATRRASHLCLVLRFYRAVVDIIAACRRPAAECLSHAACAMPATSRRQKYAAGQPGASGHRWAAYGGGLMPGRRGSSIARCFDCAARRAASF